MRLSATTSCLKGSMDCGAVMAQPEFSKAGNFISVINCYDKWRW